MKRIILSALLLLITFGLQAQAKKISPSYWVVETNAKQKNYSIIRLYDSNNQLVHEVRMDGYYFDVTRARHRKKLDLLLSGYFPRDGEYSRRNRAEKLDTTEFVNALTATDMVGVLRTEGAKKSTQRSAE